MKDLQNNVHELKGGGVALRAGEHVTRQSE